MTKARMYNTYENLKFHVTMLLKYKGYECNGKIEGNKITVIKDANLLVALIKAFNEMNQNNP